MAEPIKSPADILAACSAAFENTMSLYARRTEALTELWRAAPHVAEPKDLVALQSAYWARAFDDYGRWMSAPLARGETAAAAAPTRAA